MVTRQRDARSSLYEVAERQAGYFTAAQAREAGYSHAAQSYHAKTGNWIRDGWGVYRLALFPEAPGSELVRLMLWSRDRAGTTQAAVSHESALAAFELSDVLPAKHHLTVPPGFRNKPPAGVTLHRAALPEEDVMDWEGYRMTTPLRTLLDVAASALSPEHLEAATLQALERGLVRRRRLEEALRGASPWVRERFSRLRLP